MDETSRHQLLITEWILTVGPGQRFSPRISIPKYLLDGDLGFTVTYSFFHPLKTLVSGRGERLGTKPTALETHSLLEGETSTMRFLPPLPMHIASIPKFICRWNVV